MVDVKGRTEPRVFTPPLLDLTPDTSLGFAFIEFAELLGITLLPWQQWLAIHALELREDGTLRFRIVVVEVARQQGKSTFSQVLGLFFLFVLEASLVVGAAQDIAIAKDIWAGAVQIVQDVPELAEQIVGRPRTTNGQIELALTEFRRWVVKSSNARAGRGLSSDLVILDELREQRDWGGWASLTATTIARPGAQVWAFSNAGDMSSVVLRHLRSQAHKALGDPDGFVAQSDPDALLEETAPGDTSVDDDSLGWFEWSAPPGASLDDIDGLAQANPSLGYGFVTLRTLQSKRATDPPATYRTEVLCQFVDSTIQGVFPPGSWDAGLVFTDDARTDEAQLVGDIVAGVAMSWGRDRCAIVYGGRRADGAPQVEVVAHRPGSDWVVPWLTAAERTVTPTRVVVQPMSPAGTLIAPMKAAGLRVTELGGQDIGRAHGMLYDAVAPATEDVKCGPLRHVVNDVLDTAAATAEVKPFMGGTWGWDLRASKGDISPLVAVTNVVWALLSTKTDPPPAAATASSRRLDGIRARARHGITSDLLTKPL